MIQRVFKNCHRISPESFDKLRSITSDWGKPSSRAGKWYFELHYPDGPTTVHDTAAAQTAIQTRDTHRILISLRSPRGSFLKLDTRDRSQISCTVTRSTGDDADFLAKVVDAFQLQKMPPVVFLTHGRSDDWTHVKSLIEDDETLDMQVIELATKPHKGRYIGEKFADYAEQSSCAVIVMTGDDKAFDPEDKQETRVRENVMHELGYFQACLGPERVILLKEDGVNIPSNILGRGYVGYSKGHIAEADTKLRRELLAIRKAL